MIADRISQARTLRKASQQPASRPGTDGVITAAIGLCRPSPSAEGAADWLLSLQIMPPTLWMTGGGSHQRNP
jgi:hypothetical protein